MINDAAALRWRCWDGDFVVFNGFSGNTHRLELLAGEIFLFIATEPKSFVDISTFATEFLEVPESESLSSTLEQLLTSLEEGGLIKGAP